MIHSKVIVIGDVHGLSSHLNDFMKSNPADIYLQCGEIYWPEYNTHEIIVPLNSKLYFCDGNHDDHWALNRLKNNEVYPRCYYMKRGSTLTLPDGRVVLFIGGESYPTKEDWLKIKELLCFDDKFDKQMTDVKYKPAEKLSGEYKEILTDCGCNAGWDSGIVLDPFFGAGTTGLITLKQNKRFIGFEINPKYCKIAETRLKPLLEQTSLKIMDVF